MKQVKLSEFAHDPRALRLRLVAAELLSPRGEGPLALRPRLPRTRPRGKRA